MNRLQYVWVVYCAEDQQCLVKLPFVPDMTALQAVEQSGLKLKNILPEPLRLGIFSLKIDDPATYVLSAGDRVEIYRPLKLNPKDVRRRRAEQNPVGRFQRGNQWKRQQKSTD